jgi:archaellum component FlaG (FlaF/FlaG flagellin family)
MKNGYRSILYIFLALIIVFGLVLVLFRDTVVGILNNGAHVVSPNLLVKVTKPSSQDTLDNSILNSPGFIALKNNVAKFNFDSICSDSVGKIEIVSTSSEGVVSTTTQIVNCVKGNGVPFALPVKKPLN